MGPNLLSYSEENYARFSLAHRHRPCRQPFDLVKPFWEASIYPFPGSCGSTSDFVFVLSCNLHFTLVTARYKFLCLLVRDGGASAKQKNQINSTMSKGKSRFTKWHRLKTKKKKEGKEREQLKYVFASNALHSKLVFYVGR